MFTKLDFKLKEGTLKLFSPDELPLVARVARVIGDDALVVPLVLLLHLHVSEMLFTSVPYMPFTYEKR
jgi:hypothetical protein